MRNIHVLTLCVVGILSSASAQNRPEYFKYVPPQSSDFPDWALKMYADDPDVFEVQTLHDRYFELHPYEKDIHERNYIHWLNRIEDRVDSHGKIGAGNSLPSRQPCRSSTANWLPLGPYETFNLGSEGNFPVSWQTNVYCMDQSRSNPDILVAGSEAGDLFKSTDHGVNWFPITEALQVRTVTACGIAPSNPGIIWFCDGNANSLYKTTNGGLSWSSMASLSNSVTEITIHPLNPDVVWTAGSAGLSKSTNGGTSWTPVFTVSCWDIKYHPSDTLIMYLLKTNATAKKCEFFRSANGGTTWTLQTSGWYVPFDLSNADDGGGRIALTKAAPDMVVVGLLGESKANDNGWIGVYISHNQGLNWTNPMGQDGGPYNGTTLQNLASFQPNGSGFHQGFYNYGIGMSQSDTNTIWVGCLALSKTTDGGSTWERIGAYYAGPNALPWIHPDIQDIHVQDTDIWIASDGGINYSHDELVSHESRKYGIRGSDMWGFGQGWNEDVMAGGRYHNGNTGTCQTYGVGNHLRLGGAESPTGYVNPLKDRKVYFSDISDQVLPDSIDGAISYTNSLSFYPNTSYSTSESSEIEFDPKYSSHMFIGLDSVFYKSADEGRTFTGLYTFPGNGRVYEIEIARSDPDIMYCAYRPGSNYWTWSVIFKTTDGGVSWTKLPDPPAANRHRMELAVNPLDENELWGMSSGYSHVFRTTDGGLSWQSMETPALNGQNHKDIIFQGGSDLVYLATYTDVFYWDSGTSDWENYSNGLPGIAATLQMLPFYKDEKLRLSTRGKGIWETPMAASCLPAAQPMTPTALITCARDTVPFDCHSFLNHDSASWTWSFSPKPKFVSDTSKREVGVVFGTPGSYSVSLTITDKSGNTSTKTESNMVAVNDECGVDSVPGMAQRSVSVGDYSTTPDLGFSADHVTITAWVKPDGIQPDYSAIAISNSNTGGVNFRGGNNTLGYHWPGGAWWWNSGLIVPPNEWSHIAMVATPDSMSLYLNGRRATHITQLDTIDFDVMYIGSYKGWTSRNYFGELDELCLWKRALSQEEIREQRHLTLDSSIVLNDSDLVLYYQFNESAGPVLDRKGTQHAGMNGGAVRVNSTGPFGGGESDRLTVNSSGTYQFPNTSSKLTFPSAGNLPDGEVVVSRLHVLPDTFPANMGNTGGYFIVNNYGNTPTAALDSVRLTPFSWSPSGALVSGLTDAFLNTRNENEYLNTWQQACVDDTVLPGELVFAGTCGITDFDQWYIGISACAQSTQTLGICAGDSGMVFGSWEKSGGTFYQLIPLPAGCDSLEEVVLTVDTADAMVTQSGTTLSAAITSQAYQWIDCSNMVPVPGATNVTFTPVASGNYALIATEGNCSDTSACFQVIIAGKPESQPGWRIYPNPVSRNGDLLIENPSGIHARFALRNAEGKLVWNELITGKSALISTGSVSNGIYFYSMITEFNSVSGKLVFQ